MSPPPFRRWLLPAALLTAVLGASYLSGFVSRDQNLFPTGLLLRAKARIRSFFSAPPPTTPSPTTRTLTTALLRLRLEETPLRPSRPGAGGGITSVGTDVLLLAHEGSVFAISKGAVRKTEIQVPDNGYHDYVAAAQRAPYDRLEHWFDAFRYHDILYYSAGNQAGIVISYTQWFPKKECYATTVARLPLSPGDNSIQTIEQTTAPWETLYTTRPCLPLKKEFRALEGHMAGGHLAYRSPGRILLGSGDYHWDGVYAPIAYAQDESADYGKIIEIDILKKTARHLSLGNRNVQGLIVERSGVVWTVEHGPRGGDELNRIEEGRNYGWPKATLGTRYNGLPWPSTRQYGRHDDFTAPVFSWVPSVATSSIEEIEGFNPAWDGDLLVGSLIAQSLFRLRLMDGRVVYSEPIPIGHRIRDVLQHTDGRIFLWTDSELLVTITPEPIGLTLSFAEELIQKMNLEPERTARLQGTLERCSECHSFEPDGNARAPTLANIYGSAIAARAFNGYSHGLASRRGSWTRQELERFLASPDSFAPGTTMPDPGLESDAITDIVSLLAALRAPE